MSQIHRLWRSFVSAAAAIAVARSASAAPIYSAVAGPIGPNVDSTGVEATYDVSIPVSGPDFGRDSTQEYAAAGPAGLRASSRATLTIIDDSGSAGMRSDYTGAGATATFSDFVVSGPTCCTRVPAALNLDLSTDLTYLTSLSASGVLPGTGASFSAESLAQVRMLVRVRQFVGPFSLDTTQYLIDFSQDNTSARGLEVSGTAVPGTYTTSPFLVVPGSPFEVQISLSTGAGAFYHSDGGITDLDILADGLANLSHTVTFHTGGPVLTLPAGYTANSIDAGIVDDAYSVVPEPEPAVLVLLGLALLRRARPPRGRAR